MRVLSAWSLPTEAQFHRAAYGTLEGMERVYPWGRCASRCERGNFDFERWDPVAVGSYPDGRSAFGLEEPLGNGWEWTAYALCALTRASSRFPFIAVIRRTSLMEIIS